MSKPKVLVVGSGGVGTIAALALTLNGKAEVTLVVRSLYQQVIDEGFQISSVTYGEFANWRPTHVSRTVEDAVKQNGPFDFVVVTTKNIPDGPLPCEEIIRPAVVDGKTTIVLIQNGIEIEKPMFCAYPQTAVISGISLIGSTNINCVVNNLHKDSIRLGPFHNPNIPYDVSIAKTKEFANLYQHADEGLNKIILEDDALHSRWEKLVYNSVLNTICTISGLDVNRCQMNDANKALFHPAMDEVIAIAASEGVAVDINLKSYYQHIGDGLFYSPSMLVDRRKSQLFELEVILGNPLKVAEKNGVPAPILSTMYHLLKMIQFGIKEETGMVKVDEAAYKDVSSDDYPEVLQKHSH